MSDNHLGKTCMKIILILAFYFSHYSSEINLTDFEITCKYTSLGIEIQDKKMYFSVIECMCNHSLIQQQRR